MKKAQKQQVILLIGQGSTEISKINKNRFNKNTAIKGFRLDALGEYYVQSDYFTSDYISAKPLSYYAVNYTVTTAMQRICFYDKNKKFISANISSNVFQTPQNCKYIRICNELTYLDTAQLEENKNSTDFVEHEQTDYILNIQQEMLRGDYFVKEANGWKEVHSYSKKIFNGTEAWNLESLSQGNNFYTNIPDALGDTTAPVYSNCFMYCNGLLDKNYSCRISGSKNLNLRCNEKNTAEEFKQMLADKYNAGNPVYAFYKSAIPSKLACTPEQSAVLEELNNLDLYKPVTNIITTEDIALLKLKYALDVKTYVNNQLANVNAQILNIV